jgi:hypothetical protein
MVKLNGCGRRDRFSRVVADCDGDFGAIAAKQSSFIAAVLADGDYRREKETKEYGS